MRAFPSRESLGRYLVPMPRPARVVAPGLAHYVTQRDDRGQRTLFCAEDNEPHLDRLGHVGPLLEFAGDWSKFLSQPVEPLCVEKLQIHERTGRRLGSDRFLPKLERRLDRVLRPSAPGRKPKDPHPNRGPGK